VAIMAIRPLVRFFWRVLDALDYLLAQARLWARPTDRDRRIGGGSGIGSYLSEIAIRR
jgi:hypothetical protein